jgi:hypothetical protein
MLRAEVSLVSEWEMSRWVVKRTRTMTMTKMRIWKRFREPLCALLGDRDKMGEPRAAFWCA